MLEGRRTDGIEAIFGWVMAESFPSKIRKAKKRGCTKKEILPLATIWMDFEGIVPK